MYAERVASIRGVRFAAIEQDGTLTLRVVKRDTAAPTRTFMLLLSILTAVAWLLLTYRSTPSVTLSVLFFLLAGLPMFCFVLGGLLVAGDVVAPDHSDFRRVKRRVEIHGPAEDAGYRDNTASGTIVIDDARFDRRELGAVRVLVVLTDRTGRHGASRSTEYVPTMLFEHAAFELDRFSGREEAQELADVVLAASGHKGVVEIAESPPWNPFGNWGALPHLGAFFIWIVGFVTPLHPSATTFGLEPRSFFCAAFVVALAISVTATHVQGRRIGQLRTALIPGRVRVEPMSLRNQHAAPPAKRRKKGRRKR